MKVGGIRDTFRTFHMTILSQIPFETAQRSTKPRRGPSCTAADLVMQDCRTGDQEHFIMSHPLGWVFDGDSLRHMPSATGCGPVVRIENSNMHSCMFSKP